MSNLRTLKDMDSASCVRCPEDENKIYEEEVKAEAIKWIKNWKKINEKENLNMIYAFEVFFNITEEDLK
jgi:hypothetical protein